MLKSEMFGEPVGLFSGELGHPEGAGAASRSEERSAWLQHPRRLHLGDEHGQIWEEGGHLSG